MNRLLYSPVAVFTLTVLVLAAVLVVLRRTGSETSRERRWRYAEYLLSLGLIILVVVSEVQLWLFPDPVGELCLADEARFDASGNLFLPFYRIEGERCRYFLLRVGQQGAKTVPRLRTTLKCLASQKIERVRSVPRTSEEFASYPVRDVWSVDGKERTISGDVSYLDLLESPRGLVYSRRSKKARSTVWRPEKGAEHVFSSNYRYRGSCGSTLVFYEGVPKTVEDIRVVLVDARTFKERSLFVKNARQPVKVVSGGILVNVGSEVQFVPIPTGKPTVLTGITSNYFVNPSGTRVVCQAGDFWHLYDLTTRSAESLTLPPHSDVASLPGWLGDDIIKPCYTDNGPFYSVTQRKWLEFEKPAGVSWLVSPDGRSLYSFERTGASPEILKHDLSGKLISRQRLKDLYARDQGIEIPKNPLW